jgi:hypothetical protein
MPHFTHHDHTERLADPRLTTVATAIKQLNAVRPGERVNENAELYSVAGAAEYLNEHPESVRSALTVLRLGYSVVLDGVGYLDNSTLVAVARWLGEQNER